MHVLLARQLRRLGLTTTTSPNLTGWEALLQTVSRVYESNDNDRYSLERSLKVSSQELQELFYEY